MGARSLIVCGLVLAIAGCETQDQAQQAVATTTPAIAVSAIQLMQDYKANQVAADQKYKGQILRIRGMVDSIGKDIMDDMYVTFAVAQFQINTVQCFFAKEHVGRLAQLRKGQTITLKGRCDGETIGNIIVKGCMFE